MGYSANFTVGQKGSGKIKYFSAKQEVYHACRDLQKKKNVKLKSESIRPELTQFNNTYLKEGGKWVKPKTMDQVFDEMDHRFSTVVGSKRKDGSYNSIRKDAVAMREVVMSLGNSDNDFYKKYGDDVEKMAQDPSFKIMRDWADKEFGDHILYFSIHVDEGKDHAHHAHVHMGLDTIDRDVDGLGHFNQKTLKSISSPGQLRKAHKGFYSYLRGQGLDVSLDPEKTAQTRQRLSQSEYNAIKTVKKKVQEQDEREQALDDKASELQDWEDDLIDADARFKAKSKKEAQAIADRQAKVAKKEKEAQDKQDELDKREQDLEDREQAFEQIYQKVKEMQEALQKVKDNLIAEANTALKRFKRKVDQYKLYDTPEGQDLQKASHKLDPWLKPIDAPKAPDDDKDKGDYSL